MNTKFNIPCGALYDDAADSQSVRNPGFYNFLRFCDYPVNRDSDVADNPVASNSQVNRVDNNTGITGITGTGHTITINQCPQEIIDFFRDYLKCFKHE